MGKQMIMMKSRVVGQPSVVSDDLVQKPDISQKMDTHTHTFTKEAKKVQTNACLPES
jgi:hypothetical protein